MARFKPNHGIVVVGIVGVPGRVLSAECVYAVHAKGVTMHIRKCNRNEMAEEEEVIACAMRNNKNTGAAALTLGRGLAARSRRWSSRNRRPNLR